MLRRGSAYGGERGQMGLGGSVEPEAARAQIGELAGVDPGAHQPPLGVRIRLKQVVPDLVRDGSAQHQSKTMVVQRERFRQKLPPRSRRRFVARRWWRRSRSPGVFAERSSSATVQGEYSAALGTGRATTSTRSVAPSSASVLSRSHLSRTCPGLPDRLGLRHQRAAAR